MALFHFWCSSGVSWTKADKTMMLNHDTPKKLIEVALPLDAINTASNQNQEPGTSTHKPGKAQIVLE